MSSSLHPLASLPGLPHDPLASIAARLEGKDRCARRPGLIRSLIRWVLVLKMNLGSVSRQA